ncbi:hypothetical protein SAMN03159489_00759 [Pseudomonas sp. NFPP07]|nr:hypothetical protein SAMN03159489_00759 [Pseudomonas sp. NFPP07]
MAANQALRSVSQFTFSFIASKLRSYRILARGGCGTFLQAKKKTLNFKVFFKFGAEGDSCVLYTLSLSAYFQIQGYK